MIFQDLILLCSASNEICGSWLENEFIFEEGWMIFERWQISSYSEDFFTESGALSIESIFEVWNQESTAQISGVTVMRWLSNSANIVD